MNRRPHVVMFTTRPRPFGDAWARAARRCARVTLISGARKSLPHAARAFPPAIYARHPGDDADYAVLRSPLGTLAPRRLTSVVAEAHLRFRLRAVLRDIARRHGPIDVLHTHFFESWQLAPLACALGLPLVHTEHSSRLAPDQPMASKRLSVLGERRARKLYGGARWVMPVSSYLRRAIEERKLGGRLRVVPNPVDTALFQGRPPQARDGAWRLLSVGRLAKDKAVDRLLRALHEARRQEPGLHLDVIGTGPDEGALRDLSDRLGLADAVTFHGAVPREELPARLESAHAFVTTTRVETFGLAVVEALCAGRPVVASASGALVDHVGPGDGALVEKGPGEEQRFARALLDLLARLPGLDHAALAERAHRRFSEQAVAEQLAEVYASCG